MSIGSVPSNAKWSPTKVPKSASHPLSPLREPRSFPVTDAPKTSLVDILDIVKDHKIGRHKEHFINALRHIKKYKNRDNEEQFKAAFSNLKTLLKSTQIQGLLNEPILPGGRYPLDSALEADSPFLFKMLIEHGAKKATNFKTSLFKMESGKELLKNAASHDLASLRDVQGRTLAMKFTKDNDIDELKMLAKALNNKGFNTVDHSGKTVLNYIPYKELQDSVNSTILWAKSQDFRSEAMNYFSLMVEHYNKIMPLQQLILRTDVDADEEKLDSIKKTIKRAKGIHANFEKNDKVLDCYPNLQLWPNVPQEE